jgi:hypothetical protein
MPGIPRRTTPLPRVSPQTSTPHVADHSPPHLKHFPRVEKLPLSGYEKLASQLTRKQADHPGSGLRPIYRRFEMLNHRVLLYLQDEVCELEERLHDLDTLDTQTRQIQNCILPASRRGEALANNEVHWHKTDILGKIGFKLEQYSKFDPLLWSL